MSDVVAGTAVLDKILSPQRLAVVCRTSLGTELTRVIPVYPRGTPKPPTWNGAAWEYIEDGETLHITPSLHCTSKRPAQSSGDEDQSNFIWQTDFHNEYNWSVRFQLADGRPRDPEWETGHLYEQLRDANK